MTKSRVFAVKRLIIVFFPICIFFLFYLKCPEAQPRQSSMEHNPKTKVTHLKGSAFLLKQHPTAAIPLKAGDALKIRDHVSTSTNTMLELAFPDKSYIRFSENTEFSIDGMIFEKGTRKVVIHVIKGNAWANTAFISSSDFFSISMQNVIADTNGTVLRVEVSSDGTTVVKVYQGEAVIKHLPATKKGADALPRQEWNYIVGSMYKVIVNKDGKATRPFHFTLKSDENRWVLWNRRMDEVIHRNIVPSR